MPDREVSNPAVRNREAPDRDLPPRARWGTLLQLADRTAVLEVGQMLSAQYEVAALQVPTAGLALLQMRDAALGQRFHLGEIPCSVAAVEVRNAQGAATRGGAQVMADDAELASAIAVCDAVLEADWNGADHVRVLIAHGAEAERVRDDRRRAMLARTTVDFALLNQTLEDADE